MWVPDGQGALDVEQRAADDLSDAPRLLNSRTNFSPVSVTVMWIDAATPAGSPVSRKNVSSVVSMTFPTIEAPPFAPISGLPSAGTTPESMKTSESFERSTNRKPVSPAVFVSGQSVDRVVKCRTNEAGSSKTSRSSTVAEAGAEVECLTGRQDEAAGRLHRLAGPGRPELRIAVLEAVIDGVRVAERGQGGGECRGPGRIAAAVDDRERAAQDRAVPGNVNRLVEVAVEVGLVDGLVTIPDVQERVRTVEIGCRRAKEREARPRRRVDAVFAVDADGVIGQPRRFRRGG